jgi:hypothetical protein
MNSFANRIFQGGSRTRIEVQDRQYWMRNYVAALVENDILGQEAREALNDIPQH